LLSYLETASVRWRFQVITAKKNTNQSRYTGPEVVEQALRVLQTVASHTADIKLAVETHDFGGIAIDNHGVPLPDATLAACKSADAILMGKSPSLYFTEARFSCERQ